MLHYRVRVELDHEQLTSTGITDISDRLAALWPVHAQTGKPGDTRSSTNIAHEFDGPVDAMFVLGGVLTCYELAGVFPRFRNVWIEELGPDTPVTACTLAELEKTDPIPAVARP